MHTTPPAISMKAAREEAEMVLYECVEEALARSRLTPRQVSAQTPQHAGHSPSPKVQGLKQQFALFIKHGMSELTHAACPGICGIHSATDSALLCAA